MGIARGGEEMNEIEKMFYEKFIIREDIPCDIESQVKIGPYVVDFVYGHCVVEIDGQESHKTKEQRMSDYQRERYLQIQGYTVVRFTGTEVYRDPERCVDELIKIEADIDWREVESWQKGYTTGYSKAQEKRL